MYMIHSALHRLHNPDLGILLIRLALGAVFIFHGYQKVVAMDQTISFFAMLGFSAFLAYAAAWTELIGGIFLVGGIFVRYAGIALSIVMAVAVFAVHFKNGFNIGNGGYEYAFTLLLGSLALIFFGAGAYSLAGLCRGRMCTDCEIGAR